MSEIQHSLNNCIDQQGTSKNSSLLERDKLIALPLLCSGYYYVMLMISPIQWRGGVWKHIVEGNLILRHEVYFSVRGTGDVVCRDYRRAQVAEECTDGDIEDVIAEAPAVRKATRHGVISEESRIKRARERVTTEDTEPVEIGIARHAGRSGRQVDLNHIRDENSSKIGAVFTTILERPSNLASSGSSAYWAEQSLIASRASPAVSILILEGNKAFVE